jgi:feruloyl esterase
LYNGLPDPATGERISHPTLVPGGERDWNIVTTPGLFVLDREFLSRVVFEDTALDWRRFDFTTDTARAIELAGPILDATDPDLSAFRDHGGKLIQYHGWNDAIVLPGDSVAYYEAVDAAMASAPNPGNLGTRDFYRLFMVPGMNHCTGGPGTDQFDRQRAIEDWVERGIAPERIEARHLENGRVTHSRPLCPYPQVARYRGSGDSTSTSSFICAR